MGTYFGLLAFFLVPIAIPEVLFAQNLGKKQEQIKACRDISLAIPGEGVAYRGIVQNDDYHLRIAIPPGLTGWGAGPGAPFHGFTIFLPGDAALSECIDFEINLRVDLGDGEQQTRGRPVPKSVKVGNVQGLEEERTGRVDGTETKNIFIGFSVVSGKEIIDGSIWFVAPMTALPKDLPVFRRFLSGITFTNSKK